MIIYFKCCEHCNGETWFCQRGHIAPCDTAACKGTKTYAVPARQAE